MGKIIIQLVFIFFLIDYSNGLSLWSSATTSEDQPDTEHMTKNPPKSCTRFHVMKVRERYQGNMEDVWAVSHITPRGRSQYVDGSPACGLFNFVPGECKCLRYSLSVDEEGTNSLTRKTVGLEIKSQNFRYIESRLVFIEDHHDVFQAQFSKAAQISFDGSKSGLTASPIDEEIYAEYQAFALLGTDHYETYAVYASCTPFSSGPHAWVAISNAVFEKGNLENTLLKVENILSKNGIDFKSMITVDQDQCKP